MTSPAYKNIYAAVKLIPRGQVATYGQIAKFCRTSGPRQVGYALHALPEGHHLPWHRVINTKGEISLPAGSESYEVQRTLLEAEGVEFSPKGRVSLPKYRCTLTKV